MSTTLAFPLRRGRRRISIDAIINGLRTFGRAFWRALVRMAEFYAQRRAIKALAMLDDHVLSDIGIRRGEIYFLAKHGRDATIAARHGDKENQS